MWFPETGSSVYFAATLFSAIYASSPVFYLFGWKALRLLSDAYPTKRACYFFVQWAALCRSASLPLFPWTRSKEHTWSQRSKALRLQIHGTRKIVCSSTHQYHQYADGMGAAVFFTILQFFSKDRHLRSLYHRPLNGCSGASRWLCRHSGKKHSMEKAQWQKEIHRNSSRWCRQSIFLAFRWTKTCRKPPRTFPRAVSWACQFIRAGTPAVLQSEWKRWPDALYGRLVPDLECSKIKPELYKRIRPAQCTLFRFKIFKASLSSDTFNALEGLECTYGKMRKENNWRSGGRSDTLRWWADCCAI